MITYKKSTDGEVDMFRGPCLVGHLFNIGAPKKPLRLQVYTSNYDHTAEVGSYDAAEAWIFQQMQGDE